MGFSEQNALEFIKLYNIIDDCLSKSLDVEKNDMSFTQKVNTLRTKGDHIISHFYVDLLIYAKLRNVVVHDTTTDEPIARPSDITIEKMRQIIQLMTQAPLALDSIAHPYSELLTTKPHHKIAELMRRMHKSGAAYVPVIEDGQLAGVFSMSALTAYISAKGISDINEELTIAQMEPYYRINNAKRTEAFFSVDANADIYDIDNIFNKTVNTGLSIGAVFITHDGSNNGQLLGMVTPFDLVRINID
mgnify:CR=1 FL=1